MSEKVQSQNNDKADSQRGASVNSVSAGDVFESWLAHHQFSARMSLLKFFSEPVSTLMTSLVIGIALALPTSLLLVVENIKTLGASWDGNPQISVYVRKNVSPAVTLLLGDKLERVSGVAKVAYISPEAGLEEFKHYSGDGEAGLGDALKLLDENPLPPVYVVTPASFEASEVTALSLRLHAFSEVEFVQMDLEWVNKLQQMAVLAERFVFVFGFLFCLGVLLNIGNTIRMAIENRREEIVVVKLIGATDAFVRRPLLYSGLWYGLAGGLLACLLTALTMHLLMEPAMQLALLYHNAFALTGLHFMVAVWLLMLGGLLGLMGAWLAVTRHLHQVQPC